MKKIVSVVMIATAFVFSACSNDDFTPPSDNGVKTGMILNATVAGQNEGTRATWMAMVRALLTGLLPLTVTTR